MHRDVFPFEGERETMRAFLMGRPQPIVKSDITAVNIVSGALMFNHALLAQYAPSGELMVVYDGRGYEASYIRALNWMLEELGIPDRIAVDSRDPETYLRSFAIGGQLMHANVPIMVAGPMTIQAYRSMHKSRP